MRAVPISMMRTSAASGAAGMGFSKILRMDVLTGDAIDEGRHIIFSCGTAHMDIEPDNTCQIPYSHEKCR